MSSSNQAVIKNLSDEITFVWGPTKTKLMDQQADIVLLKTFFKNWQDDYGVEIKKPGETPDQAAKDSYKYAISKLPKDNPNTPFNEEITEKQLLEKIEKDFGKPLGTVTSYDVKKLETDVQTLMKKVRYFVAYGMFAEDQIRNAQKKIDQLNAQTNFYGPMYGESDSSSGKDGPSTFLS